MSWLKRIFGGGEKKPIRSLDELTAPVAQLARPAVLLIADAKGRCRIGGTPSLPADTTWPHKDGRPLGFVATLDLSENAFSSIEWLPHTGHLHFFFDLAEQPWGFDPKDAGSWAVLHALDPGVATAPPDPDRAGSLVPQRYTSRAVRSLPDEEHPAIRALRMNRRESKLYRSEGREANVGDGIHRIAGYADAVQDNEMELQCQLTSNGLFCGDSSGYEHPRAKELEAGAKDWKLLLQIDSTYDWMWGDMGKLYFWIREDDARRGAFDGAWVVMQCH